MDNSQNNKLKMFDLVILALSVYVLIALLADTFFKLPPELSKLLNFIDNIVCAIFLIDFFYRLFKAESKLKFLKWGWIDFISSIPMVDFLRWGRAFRIMRLFRLLRAFRSTKYLASYVFRNRQQGAFTSVAIIAILMVIFSSIAMLQVETDPNSNIKTAEDSIWWAFVTVTTVGYGDKYPVTTEGRVIAAFLMITGVGLFGAFTGFVASWFVEDKGKDKITDSPNT
ncbi:MAG: ion transporter [Bacteroidales bacterium]|nr:MAG: ion transporter [Bacteroidales bacterium]